MIKETLKLGVATVDITPPVGVLLMGYKPRQSESVGHLLRAEALACEGKDEGWILVCADLVGFSSPLATVVREEIGSRTGLPTEAVMLTGTHTHSGPHVTDALWREQSELESTYFRTLRDKLVKVAERAWECRSPGILTHTTTAAPGLASNRRVHLADGTWSNEWSDPDGRHQGYYDPAVELIGVQRDDATIEALLVNYGCHAVCFGAKSRAISGDYVSYLKDNLESEGKVGTVLFTASGHGNIDPRICVQGDVKPVRDMGNELAEIISDALPSLAPLNANGVATSFEPWTFTTTWNLSGRMLIYFPHAANGATVNTGVSALTAGNLALLGLPGEAVSEYRQKLRQISPFTHTIMVSLANDFLGYLPTDEILEQGAYEAGLCPLNPLEESLTGKAKAALKRAYDG